MTAEFKGLRQDGSVTQRFVPWSRPFAWTLKQSWSSPTIDSHRDPETPKGRLDPLGCSCEIIRQLAQ